MRGRFTLVMLVACGHSNGPAGGAADGGSTAMPDASTMTGALCTSASAAMASAGADLTIAGNATAYTCRRPA